MRKRTMGFIAVFCWVVIGLLYIFFAGTLQPHPALRDGKGMLLSSKEDTAVCWSIKGPMWCTPQEKWDEMISPIFFTLLFSLPVEVFLEGGGNNVWRTILMVVILTPYIAIPLYFLAIYRIDTWVRDKKMREPKATSSA